MKLMKKKKGFTIVELVIVIGVIGILAGILIPTFVNVNQKAEEAALKSNLANAYSSYVADAADGVIDTPKDVVVSASYTEGHKYTIELKEQAKVVLQDAKGTYHFDGAAWVPGTYTVTVSDNGVATDTTVNPETKVEVKYNGFSIFAMPEA